MAGEERLTWLRDEAEGPLRQFLGDAGLVVPTAGQGSPLDPEKAFLRLEYGPVRPVRQERNRSRRSEHRAEYGAIGPARQERGTSRRSERELRTLAKEIKLLITEDKRRGLEV